MTDQINPLKIYVLVEEVAIQANLALMAYQELRRLAENPETRQRRELWAYVQSLLAHTAMISKFMKPIRNVGLASIRAILLKALLNLEDDSPVFCRGVRDNVEHLDERIDTWLASEKSILESVFENRGVYDYLNMPENGEERRWFVRRVYLINEDVFISEGRQDLEEIDLTVLATELRRIRDKADAYLDSDQAITIIAPNQS